MPVCFVVETLAQCRGIDEVAVVGHGDSVRAVDVERLSLCVGTASSSRISQVTETHEAREIRNSLTLLEHSGGKAVAFALVETSTGTASNYTSRILATVL